MSEDTATERLKAKLLDKLSLVPPDHLEAFWDQVLWPKPNLVEQARTKSPLAYALSKLQPEILVRASQELDPYGWLLRAANVTAWSKYCHTRLARPWMTRIWLATASQLHAERTLLHKACGWSDTWEELRRKPKHESIACADDHFIAQLSHAKGKMRAKILKMPGLKERLIKARQEKDYAFLRRFSRAAQGTETTICVPLAEKFIVQYWLELPHDIPGLCFFSDSALHALLTILRLKTGGLPATKQIRVRLGLIQAGVKRHLVERVNASDSELCFNGKMRGQSWVCSNFVWHWDTPQEKRQLWPQKGAERKRKDRDEVDITPLKNRKDL